MQLLTSYIISFLTVKNCYFPNCLKFVGHLTSLKEESRTREWCFAKTTKGKETDLKWDSNMKQVETHLLSPCMELDRLTDWALRCSLFFFSSSIRERTIFECSSSCCFVAVVSNITVRLSAICTRITSTINFFVLNWTGTMIIHFSHEIC